MKIYVTELPKTKEQCPFFQGGACIICKNDCDVKNCNCLESFSVIITSFDDEINTTPIE